MEKETIYYGVIDKEGYGILADGSEHCSIYFSRKNAENWRKEMLGKEGRVVKIEIKILTPSIKTKLK